MTAAEIDLSQLRIERPGPRPGPRSRRRRRRLIGATAVLGLGGAALVFLWPRLGPLLHELRAPRVVAGFVVRTRPGSSLELTTASGYVVARTRAALATRLSGRLVEMAVDVGDTVKAGQVVARIDPTTWLHLRAQHQSRVEQARAQLAVAESDTEIARNSVQRLERSLTEAAAARRETEAELAEARRVLDLERRLQESGSGTEDSLRRAESEEQRLAAALDRRRAALEILAAERDAAAAEVQSAQSRTVVAQSSIREAAAHLAAAETDLADTELRAPFAGVILHKEAEIGEMVVPALAGGSTSRGAVVTLADFATLEMEVDVFERDIRLVAPRAPAEIVVNALPDVRFPARVRQVVPTADRTKGTVQVKVAFEVPDPRILPEMGGKVIFLRERPAADLGPEVTAPLRAVVTRDQRQGVFVLEEGRARFQEVQVGDARDSRLVILSGLGGGERVVLDPPAALENGDMVMVVEKDA